MKKVKTSLVVLNYNGLNHLEEYFDSVFKQTTLPTEILMMDNASTDGSREFVKKYYSKVKIISNRFNAGTAQGSNIAAKYAKGDYLIFQSNDIRLDRNCLRFLEKTIGADSTIGICTSVSLFYKKDKETKKKLIESAGGDLDVYGFTWPKDNAKKLNDIEIVGDVFISYGGSFMIKKSLFEKLGGFDEKFFTLNDDIDLSWRVRMLGLRVVYTNKSFFYHKGHATLGFFFPRSIKRYWSERNCFRTILKNYSLTSLLKYLPSYLLLLLIEILYYSLFRRKFSLSLAVLRAIGWNLLYLPDTLLERRKIQKIRKVDDKDLLKLMHKKSYKLEHFKDFSRTVI